jgi:hypothetical protein
MKKLLVTLGVVVAVVMGMYAVVVALVWTLVAPHPAADKPRFDAAARSGVPLVEAIYQYRNDTELFPERVEDLEIVAHAGVGPTHWWYEWNGGYPRLKYEGAEADNLVYLFGGQDQGWQVYSRAYNELGLQLRISAPVKIPAPPERSQAEKQRLIVTEIERRIARDRSNVIHHQGLISHLMRANDPERALVATMRMHERRLEPWWELQVLARLLHQLGEDNWAEWEMLDMAGQAPEFHSFFYLAWFYREAGQTDAALEMIGKASTAPFSRVLEDHYVDDYYFWLSAVYAYKQRRPDLVLAVCDAWQKIDRTRGWGTPNPLAIRAMALLAQGKTADAKASIDAAIQFQKAEGGQVCWAGKLEKMAAAIQRGDPKYRWKPESYPNLDDYELLITYR